jgi:hypothetical protein
LREIAEDKGQINRRRLGRWISRHQGRIVDGLRFVRASGTTSAERWQAKSVTSDKSAAVPGRTKSVEELREEQRNIADADDPVMDSGLV